MTSKESFAVYEAVCKEEYPGLAAMKASWKTATEVERDAMIKEEMKWDDEHKKRIREAIRNLIPEEGVKCTVIYYSDKRAATVSRIISPCKIAVRHNKVVCKDWYGSDYDILPELEGGEQIFTKRRNGLWCMEGHSTKDGVLLMLHYQRHYIDPSF